MVDWILFNIPTQGTPSQKASAQTMDLYLGTLLQRTTVFPVVVASSCRTQGLTRISSYQDLHGTNRVRFVEGCYYKQKELKLS